MHPRFYKTLAECDISLPLEDLVNFRYVLMNTFQGAHMDIANIKSSLRIIISGSPHSRSTDIRRGGKGGHRSKPVQSLCMVSGKFPHNIKACPFKSSAHANHTSSAYVGSAGHVKLVADKLSQSIRPNLQPKIEPTRSEVRYLPLRLQTLSTPRQTLCL